ncbi:MAG: polysaccharide biosynthesis C-terminal domain-containing protein [Candidatus Kapaibacterium sp.]
MAKERTFRDRATRGFAWNYLYKLTEFGLLNLYTILVVRHFGPEISAPYAVFAALCTLTAQISAFAVDEVLLRYIQRISANENPKTDDITKIENLSLPWFLKRLFAFRILVVTFISALVFISLLVLPYFVPSLAATLGSLNEFSPYLIIFLYAQAAIAFCTFSLIGLLETKLVFFASLVSRSLLLFGGIYFLFQGSLTLQYAVGLYVASAVINALYLLFIFSGEVNKFSSQGSSEKFSFSSMLGEIRNLITRPRQIKLFLATPLMLYGITNWASQILSGVLGRQPDIIMMRAMLGEHSSDIGYYLSASLLFLITEYVFLIGLGGTLVSVFSKLAHDDEKQNEKKKYPLLAKARHEIAGFQNVVLLPLCAYMLIFAPAVMGSVYGSKYDPAIPMLRVGLTALVLTVGIFAGGMQITTLVAIGKERWVFRNRLCWGIANIVANFFLIRSYGGLGAIIGTQFSNMSACATEYYLARKFVAGSFNLSGTLRIVAISIASVTGSYFLIQMVGKPDSQISNAVLGGLCTAAAVSGLYALFRVPEAKKVWRRMVELFNQSRSAALANE